MCVLKRVLIIATIAQFIKVIEMVFISVDNLIVPGLSISPMRLSLCVYVCFSFQITETFVEKFPMWVTVGEFLMKLAEWTHHSDTNKCVIHQTVWRDLLTIEWLQ